MAVCLTWPRHPSSHLTYDHKHSDRFEPDSSGGFYPQYPFGHGLSYTAVEYSNFSLTDSIYHVGDTIRGSIDITNTGDRTANELVLVFSQDHVASITPSVRRLRDFERVFIGPDETVTYDLSLPISALSFVHRDFVDRVEPGDFTFIVADATAEFKIE